MDMIEYLSQLLLCFAFFFPVFSLGIIAADGGAGFLVIMLLRTSLSLLGFLLSF